MVVIEHKVIREIPVLELARQEIKGELLPFIIFVHGFTSAKEHNLHYAYLLAEKGFRVVLPDTLFHGERSQGLSGSDLNFKLWDIVLNTIAELNIIKNVYKDWDLIDQERIGLVGTSMGGIVTLGALTQYEWVKTAVSLMGMPYYEKFAQLQLDELKKNNIRVPLTNEELADLLSSLRERDLSLQPEKLGGRPIMFWHGKKDPVVPYSYTYQFYETIQPMYNDSPENLLFITDEQAGHKVSREGLLETVRWFEEHL
ncbi:putative esterase YitV [Bacillus sp. ZZV12-4809]|uniref:alpha/beta fold hydrolase n=1 Tax=Cytobacillus sp. AMY 15.2 TaxID=2939563 RepID=UPI00135AC67B|nr:alpha/beta fold hydrolase [Cytobacillus sp. AMY 15.2]KAF0818079.1 putative esterase YitV [Bacillus sp. ZZV12-4809]MCM3092342.1 prolyl oligopeptidase family serine peptidase [Cytobacillus sp. AMY 15.2]